MEGLQLGVSTLEGVVEENDDDEVEYMPPPAQGLSSPVYIAQIHG